ncbi:MAG TPA: hypothetical protein VGL07_17050 [Buttiauxella sp.]|jgi:hypothetical protein
MTPTELLEDVSERFVTLLYDDPQKLKKMLVRALGMYQDKAGSSMTVELQEEGGACLPAPADMTTLISVEDQVSEYVSARQIDGEIRLSLSGRERWPLRMTYLQNLRKLDLEKGEVPETAIGMIGDYLEILISIPNADLLRLIAIDSKLNAVGVPDEALLFERKKQMELEMASNRVAIGMARIRG